MGDFSDLSPENTIEGPDGTVAEVGTKTTGEKALHTIAEAELAIPATGLLVAAATAMQADINRILRLMEEILRQQQIQNIHLAVSSDLELEEEEGEFPLA